MVRFVKNEGRADYARRRFASIGCAARPDTTPCVVAGIGRVLSAHCAEFCVKSAAFTAYLARPSRLMHCHYQTKEDATWLISQPRNADRKSPAVTGFLWQLWQSSGLSPLLSSTVRARLIARHQVLVPPSRSPNTLSKTDVPDIPPPKGGGFIASAHACVVRVTQQCTRGVRSVYTCHTPISKVLPC